MRYPTSSSLALPVGHLGFETVPFIRRQTSQHHMYFPRADYAGVPIRHQFRNLVSNVVTMHNDQHQELHEIYSGPVIPRLELMVDVLDEYLAINGVINCIREKKTSEVYQIQPQQWELIKHYGRQ